jgi:hypothetical protein
VICRRAFGRRITGSAAKAFGLNPEVSYRLCLRVLGMGTSNAPGAAQVVHETVLEAAGCMRPGTVRRCRDSMPDSALFEGVYLDDHLIIGIVPRSNVDSATVM